MFWVLLLAAAPSPGPPHITISPKGNGYIATVEAFDGRYQEQIDADIDKRASEICQGKSVRWGEFGSDMQIGKQPSIDSPRVSGFLRAFSCVTPVDRNFAAAPVDWKPSARDEADVRRIFQTYYGRRDANDFRGAKSMFAPDVLGADSSWAEQMAKFNQAIGPGTRSITGITWYVNPESAPHPGVYVAIDFSGKFARAHFYCGYVVLFRVAEGTYEITREEQNQFPRGKEAADPAQLAQMRSAMCRGE